MSGLRECRSDQTDSLNPADAERSSTLGQRIFVLTFSRGSVHTSCRWQQRRRSMKLESSEFDLVIEAGRTERHYWMDLWRYRELFYFLAWRDILVRYKQTVIGIAWAILRPFLTMLVFVLVFHTLGKFPSDGVPYPILVYAAMLPWQFFSTALSEASGSLIGNASLI